MDPKVGSKGLGQAGSVPIPEELWKKHALVSLECRQ